jgi:serine/threonine-protein kinase
VDLSAVAFNTKRADRSGTPQAVLSVNDATNFAYDMSRAGTLLYWAGESQFLRGCFAWLVRGNRSPPPLPPPPPPATTELLTPRLSPDGKWLLYHHQGGGFRRIVAVELATGVTRVVATGAHYWAIWSADGTRIIYQEPPEVPGGAGLSWKPVDGSGPAERLTSSKSWQQPQVATRDGRYVIFQETGGLGTRDTTLQDNYDLWLLPINPRGEPRPLLRTKANERLPHLSPDQRWMAYVSDDSGRAEIWVRPFPDAASAIQVSQDGGTEPVWAPDGQALYYRDATGMRLFAVPVTLGTVPRFGTPTVTSGLWTPARPFGRVYDIMPDGTLLMLPAPTLGRELHVVFNFDEVIRRKMAAALK